MWSIDSEKEEAGSIDITFKGPVTMVIVEDDDEMMIAEILYQGVKEHEPEFKL